MDGSREYHTKWSKGDKDKYIISLIYGIPKKDTNELIYKANRSTDIENKLLATKGEVWGRIN